MRIGIVGCGRMGQRRARAARGHDIVAVADADTGRAAQLAAEFGATAVGDWRAVVGAELDAVFVATPHDALAPIALAAIEAGKHVFVEKPGARSAAELAPVMAAAKAQRRVVKVGYDHRFHPAFVEARRLVDVGDLGQLLYVRGRYGHGGRKGYETEWRLDPARAGGGELIDQGSHLIDLARWFLGELDVAFAAMPTYFWKAPVEDNCFLALRSASGRLAWLHASWTEWRNLFSFEIVGRAGAAVVDGVGGSYGAGRLTVHRRPAEMGPPRTTIQDFPSAAESWQREFAEFESAVREDREPMGGLADAFATLTIIERIYERARS